MLTASGALPGNMNYAVKSSFLLGFLEAVPEVSSSLPAARSEARPPEDLAAEVRPSAVLIRFFAEIRGWVS